MRKLFVLLVGIVVFAGCSTQTFYVNGNAGISPDKEKLQTFFIHGIAQEQEMNAADVCGGAEKVAKVQSKLNFIDGLLGAITFGLYTPRTAMVYCSK